MIFLVSDGMPLTLQPQSDSFDNLFFSHHQLLIIREYVFLSDMGTDSEEEDDLPINLEDNGTRFSWNHSSVLLVFPMS